MARHPSTQVREIEIIDSKGTQYNLGEQGTPTLNSWTLFTMTTYSYDNLCLRINTTAKSLWENLQIGGFDGQFYPGMYVLANERKRRQSKTIFLMTKFRFSIFVKGIQIQP